MIVDSFEKRIYEMVKCGFNVNIQIQDSVAV